MEVTENIVNEVVERGHSQEKTFEDSIISNRRELNIARKSASKKLLTLLTLIPEQVDILFAEGSVRLFMPLHVVHGISQEGEIYGTKVKSIFYVRKDRISWQRAGALHMQAIEELETLRKKYLIVEAGDIDRLYVTNVNLGRSDPCDILAVVAETEFCQLSEQVRIN